MTQPTSPPHTQPWKIEVLPDFFGYHLWVDGKRFYILKEHFDAVIVAMAIVKERESVGHDWLIDLAESIRAEKSLGGESTASDG